MNIEKELQDIINHTVRVLTEYKHEQKKKLDGFKLLTFGDYVVKEGENQMPLIKDGHIRRKENGVWEIRYRKNGYNKSFSSKNLETAKKAFKTFLNEIKGKIKPNTEKNDYTLNNGFEQWFNELHSINVKEVTAKTTLRYFNKHIRPNGNIQINQPSSHFQKILLDLVKDGKTKTATELRTIWGFSPPNRS